MNIDKAWSHYLAGGINFLATLPGCLSHLADSIGIDRDISEVGGSAGATHREAIACDQIMHKGSTEGYLSVQVDIRC